MSHGKATLAGSGHHRPAAGGCGSGGVGILLTIRGACWAGWAGGATLSAQGLVMRSTD